ncbi:von willebrand domain containing protein [Colletotrichum kahawae]|uniref:von willebrand domain containing protein n=1 Tax=Colletotrichum kahawae TaxID=34407 RepID=A0AAD9XX33_COLKA|nr:von willebrand domain containing protein [Colletotrichum kahawae]
MAGHVCGLYYLDPTSPYHYGYRRNYLPTVSQSVHARVVASTARTTLTQTFVNPSKTEAIPELRYTFPLYDGVSVVGFTCTINNSRVIRGVVQEKNTARNTYDAAVAKGETAGLFEQLPEASDVFTTTIGNAPAGAELKVEIAYLGELKHDAEVDGIRLTIPTSIAPRYGSYPGTLMEKPSNVSSKDGIEIVVDAEMPDGSAIKSIQSPSHPIAVSVGSTSTMGADATPSLQLASATLSLGTAELERDFIVQIIATNTSNPVAVLETHPTIPHQQAIMATLVPKFKLATTKPEVVFVCDRSGSMQGKINDLKNALQIYMKSLPVGCMFNICSFGSRHTFLFPKSQTYDQNTLKTAMKHIDTFGSDYGGTELYAPIEDTFKRRHKDLDLEVFVLTDGEVWNHDNLFGMVNKHVEDSKGAIRLFTLGIGRGVSHALVEGLARAGQGFSQTVSEKEKMSGKVVRMLKGALTPHVKDYSLEVKYADAESETEPEDDFEIIDPASPKAGPSSERPAQQAQKPISLFDPDSEDVDLENTNQQDDATGTERFSHVPAVKPPKILQAPFRIPPLYPYSRTSVYLLISPERALRTRTPQSVVLRGTSSQGPLELEIPVTVLPEKAETIHQLAARKAVKELEEGRGWIFHAKGKDGRELKKSHPGRFPAMVEREAVRLGVGFQVGGKWCSFVAVEGSEDDGDAVEPPVEEVPAPAREAGRQGDSPVYGGNSPSNSPVSPPAPAATTSVFGSKPAAGGLFDCSASPGPAASSSLFGSKPTTTGGLFGGSTSSAPNTSSSPFGNKPSTGVLFGSSPPFLSGAPQAFANNAFSRSDKYSEAPPSVGGGLFGTSTMARAAPPTGGGGGGLFGTSTSTGALFGAPAPAPAPVVQAAALAPPSRQVDASLLAQYQKEMEDAASMDLIDYSDEDVDLGPSPPKPAAPAPKKKRRSARNNLFSVEAEVDEEDDGQADEDASDSFSALVEMQDFSGFWAWSARLLKVLGVAEQQVNDALGGFQASQNVVATAVVVAFLRNKLAHESESWEMMEEKAVAWLEGEVGDDEVGKVLAAAEALF